MTTCYAIQVVAAKDVCSKTFRKWKKLIGATTIIILNIAHLQLHVAEKLWKYQLIRQKGQTY